MGMSPRLLRPRASGLLDLKTISGLQLWLSGDSGTFDATSEGSAVVADGSVARWEDRSGNGRHFTQSTANNRPTLRTGASGKNGRPVLEFDGSNDSVSAIISSIAQPFTMFFVGAHADTTKGQSNVCDGTSSRVVLGKGLSGSIFFFLGSTSITANNVFTNNTYSVISAIANGASSSIRKNETTISSGNSGNNVFGNGSVFLGRNAASGQEQWVGTMAEFVVFSGTLSSSSLSAVEKYLKTKWGVT